MPRDLENGPGESPQSLGFMAGLKVYRMHVAGKHRGPDTSVAGRSSAIPPCPESMYGQWPHQINGRTI